MQNSHSLLRSSLVLVNICPFTADYKSVEFDIRHKNVTRNAIHEMWDLNKCNKSLTFNLNAWHIEENEKFNDCGQKMRRRIRVREVSKKNIARGTTDPGYCLGRGDFSCF